MNKVIIIFAILGSIFHSCPSSQKSTYMGEWFGKKIIIPSDTSILKLKNEDSFDNFFHPNNLKLIISVNGECGSCIDKLKAVENFAEYVLSLYSNISLLVFVNSKTTSFNNFELMNQREIRFKYPIIYDLNNSYLKINKIPSNDFYKMLLCDENDEIIMIGDFTAKNEVKEMYLKILRIHAKPLIIDSPIAHPIRKEPRKGQ